MEKDIIQKLKDSGLTGRGGAGFPAGVKWEAVKNASQKFSVKTYIICNAAEGEPDVFKDKFILDNYLPEIINGIKIALNTFENSVAYIYLNHNYYDESKDKIERTASGLPISLVKKPDKYIAGEETSVIEVIEGKRPEPRLKPPYPTEAGLWGGPTLINNVETFYYVSKVSKGEYKNTRFFCVSGDVKNKGVFELSENFTVKEILRQTQNFPEADFFVQVGGGACGQILLTNELNQPVCGAGSIVVYDKEKTDLFELMKKWADFFIKGNCDKCVPCREGVYRISEMVKTRKIDKKILEDLCFVLENTSFCPLGKSAAISFKSLINKLIIPTGKLF